METLETVKIVSDRQPSGYVIINKSDFDKSKMQLFGMEKKLDFDDEKPKRAYSKKAEV